MQFLDDVKRRMMAAMKAGDVVRKEILRVAVGEITTNEARGTVKTEDDERAIVRKLMKSNEETLSLTTDEAQKQVSRPWPPCATRCGPRPTTARPRARR
jgi:uncharacterized protein YqeY